MPPSAITATDGRRSKSGARKSFVPVIPRALEKVNTPKSSEVTTPSTASENKDHGTENVADSRSSGGDWASIVDGEDEESTKVEIVHGVDGLNTAAKTFTETNGYVPGEVKADFALEDNKKQQTLSRSPRTFTVSGTTASFSPDSSAFLQRFDTGIVFGGSVVSNDSSPIIPPSASSFAATRHTPLSEATPATAKPAPPKQSHAYSTKQNSAISPKMYEPIQSLGSVGPDQTPILHHQGRLDHRFPAGAPLPPLQRGALGHDHLMSARANQADALHHYLLTQFNNRELADCTLDLRVRGQGAHLFLHSVIAARSPKIRSLLASDAFTLSPDGKKHLVLDPTDAHVSIPALVSALRVCYGAPAAASHYSTGFHAPPQADERGYLAMDMCLGYLAAGHLLQLSEVAAVGLESACNLINVEYLEMFLGFGLNGALDSFEAPTTNMMSPTGIGRATYAPYSDSIIGAGIHFLVGRLHGTFSLDITAPASEKLGGIPNFQDTDIGHRRLSSNPRLSYIQFGQLHSSTDSQTVTLSTVLLSLPFEILCHILAQLARPSLNTEVIEERERRRHEYLKRFAFPDGDENGVQLVNTRAQWMETVDATGMGVSRQWVGN